MEGDYCVNGQQCDILFCCTFGENSKHVLLKMSMEQQSCITYGGVGASNKLVFKTSINLYIVCICIYVLVCVCEALIRVRPVGFHCTCCHANCTGTLLVPLATECWSSEFQREFF